MKPQVISKANFAEWVDKLIKKGRVVGVKEKESGKFEFGDIVSSDFLRLDYDVTVLPPKIYIQPQKEALLEFTTGKTLQVKPVIDAPALTIIGVHPYDMRAIDQMDRIFALDNKDTNYLERRKKIAIIGIDPVTAGKWAFWSEMVPATVQDGYDIWLTFLGDKYIADAKTSTGKTLLKLARSDTAKDADLKLQKESRSSLKDLCRADRKIKASVSSLPSLFRTNHEHEIWEKKAKTCYSCGSCNLVCPTCYCFDVREEFDLNLKSGKRMRYWDGCLLKEFASVGSGENFREERSHRFRHRLLRKMTFMFDKIGDIACVGCGRCSSACLPDIADPVKIINELGGASKKCPDARRQ